MAIKDISGQRFGRLLAVRYYDSSAQGLALWLCECDCGKKIVAEGHSLRRGRTKSCGCLHRDRIKEAKTTHGHYVGGRASKTRKSWEDMISRCTNPNHKNWDNYGGRGIKVCDRWLRFENFLEDMGERPKGLTLERYDVNGNYCLENCGWESTHVQARNRRNNRLIVYQGITAVLKDHCDRLGLNYRTIKNRLNRSGWTVEQAFETSDSALLRSNAHIVVYQGVEAPIKRHCDRLGLNYDTIKNRIVTLKWSVDDAFTKPIRKAKQ